MKEVSEKSAGSSPALTAKTIIMTIKEVKEQLQEDMISLLESIGLGEVLSNEDFEHLKTDVCDIVITNLNKLDSK